MTSAFTWVLGFLTGATVGWICRARQLPMGPPKGSYGPRRPGLTTAIRVVWRDEPVRLDPGNVQRGNGSGGPTTPKPQIVPKSQLPSPLLRPAQPLAADLIRYQRWQQQQIERALRDEPPTPN